MSRAAFNSLRVYSESGGWIPLIAAESLENTQPPDVQSLHSQTGFSARPKLNSTPNLHNIEEQLSLEDVKNYSSPKLNLNTLGPSLVNTYSGKVRNNYTVETNSNKELIISEASDRTSAFDIPNLIPKVPYKGLVLDTISKHWAKKIEDWGYKTDLVKDHGLNIPNTSAVTVREPLDTIPIEFVARRYLTGTTSTSLSQRYFKAGERDFEDFKLKDGLELHSRLNQTILTSTTKEKEDRNVSKLKAVDFILEKYNRDPNFKEVFDKALEKLQNEIPELKSLDINNPVDKKILSVNLYEKVENMIIDVFNRAEAELMKKGLLLIDTKFELGIDKDGDIRFMDELLTPDSSRYWSKESLERAMLENKKINAENKKFFLPANPADLFSMMKFPASLDKDLMRNIARDRASDFNQWKTENAAIIKANQTKSSSDEYLEYKSQFFSENDVQKLANGYLKLLKLITGKELNINQLRVSKPEASSESSLN